MSAEINPYEEEGPTEREKVVEEIKVEIERNQRKGRYLLELLEFYENPAE